MYARIELPTARAVCPTATRRLLAEGALLVDVRELREVATTAFDTPRVALMPMSELEQRYEELPRDRQLVLASNSGRRSLKATCILMVHGYSQVAHMEGGLVKWARRGLPIRGSVPAGVASADGNCCS